MKYCPQCGNENRDEARFCVRCGNRLPEPQAEEPPAPPESLPEQPTPYAPPAPGLPHAGVPPAASPPHPHPAPVPPRYTYGAPARPATAGVPYRADTGKKRKAAFWVGAAVLLLAGLLVLLSSFMPWIKGPFGFGSVSGMDFVTREETRMDNLFFDYGDGYPLFSGLTSLILGLLVAFLAVVMLASRSKWPAGLALLFCVISLGMAGTNLSSILRGPEGADLISAGSGIYVFIVFSLLGLAGSITSLAG
ncbi:MAG: zinc ribbon domain-containing protein [Actinobacteria bacterium]|nr:zinc ribbon domain-containing protein [Actinomycetota bacterium]